MNTATEQKSGERFVLLSVAEAAKRLRISRRAYYYKAQTGEVPKPANVCGKSSVPEHEIDAVIAKALAARGT